MTMSPSILMLGLEKSLAAELRAVLSSESNSRIAEQPGASISECIQSIERLNPDLVFCPSDTNHCQNLLYAIRNSSHSVPVVVVSRVPEVSDWLDALEAGAFDYCAAPFETRQVRWILDRSLALRPLAAAVAV